MSTIKAIVNVGRGDARILDVPYPTLPEDDYILIKATAWAINAGDVHHLDMEAAPDTAGCHVGWDYAGVVVEVGPAVTKEFKKGDRVAGITYGHNYLRKTDGAFADYLTARGDIQLKVPDNLTDAEAATQGVAVGTLTQSLYRDLQLPWPTAPSPFTLFIYGGSTGMGIHGIQLAKLSGGTVITTASPSNSEYLRSLGADHVIDYRSPNLAQEVLEAAGGVPLKYALDCHPSAASATTCASVLARDGTARYVHLLEDVDKIVKEQNPSVQTLETQAYSHMGMDWQYDGVTTPASPEDYALAKKFAPLAEELLATGKLKVPRVFLNRGGKGLEGVMKGLDEVRQNRVSGGKLVYTAE